MRDATETLNQQYKVVDVPGGVNHHFDNPVVPEKAPDKARGEKFGHFK